MDLREAQTLARTAMRAHGLYGWTFKFNRRRNTFGVCFHQQRTIELSTLLTQHGTREQVTQTIGHEIAHALVGAGEGHGPKWKAQMREMGLRPDRCGEANDTQKIILATTAKYTLTCATSGDTLGTLDRIVKSRRVRTRNGYGIRTYGSRICKCHRSPVLYNGKTWEAIS